MQNISGLLKIKWLCYVILVLAISCKKHDPQPKSTFLLSGEATGGQVIPLLPQPNDTAKGSITGNYYRPSRVVSYTIFWSVLTGAPTGIDIYGTPFTGAQGILNNTIPVLSTVRNGNYSGYLSLTSLQETDLMAGKWYYHIKTVANPTGEVRGQIEVK
jgi:hypothetical protein